MTALGELAASIAHEVNQPLTAIINNASACLALLPSDTDELDEVCKALSEIADDADRASAVLARIQNSNLPVCRGVLTAPATRRSGVPRA